MCPPIFVDIDTDMTEGRTSREDVESTPSDNLQGEDVLSPSHTANNTTRGIF